MRTARKRWLATVAAATALAAAGCGGGDDSESSSTAATPPERPGETSGSPAPASQSSSSGEKGDAKKGEARERAEYERERYGSTSPESAPFEKYAERAGPKLHLAEFGDEADGGDREAAEAAVVAYLTDVVAGRWDEACTYLQEGAFSEILEATSDSGADCGAALRAAIKMFEESGGGRTAVPDSISSLRIETGEMAGEGAGFALFHTVDGDRWIAVRKEGGEWKLVSIAPQPFR
jgi:hypothetical protein